MATHLWTGQTVAVAQTATVQITAYDATTTYKLTVNGVVVSTIGTGGSASTTATALAAAWNASTHPYFSGVTAAANTDTVTLTADTAGVPFTATSSVTGGAGTIGSVTAGTANAGPNVLAAANFDSATLPGNGDTVIFENSAVDVLWALDAMTAVTTLTIIIYPTYTGKIGLNKRAFATSATATNTSYPEYREDELTIDGATLVWMPVHVGTTSPGKSTRILINTKTSAANFVIEDTATTAAETDQAPVRIKGSNASSTLIVRGSSSLGVATNDPADTAQFTTVEIGDSAKVVASSGVTIATLTLRGAPVVRLGLAPTTINGGTDGITASLTTAFTGTVTTMTIGDGMTVYHTGGATTITTLNQYGTLDISDSRGAFTVTTYNVLSSDARFVDPFNKIVANTDFVFGSGIVPDSFFDMAGGRTLRKTA